MQRTFSMQHARLGGVCIGHGKQRYVRLLIALWIALGSALLMSLATVQVVSAQQQGWSTHVVQSGETLGAIAQRYGLNWRDLARWNGIGDASRIYPGQTLTVYAGSGQSWGASQGGGASGQATWSGSAPATGGSGGSTTTAGGGTHVVQAGETLLSIAQRYGVTPPQLVRVNGLSQPPALYPGQTLILPGGGSGNAAWGSGATATQSTWGTPESAPRSAPPAAPAYSGGYGGGNVTTPQAPSSVGKTVLLSIAQQYLWAFENGRLVLQTPVTTGRPGADTPTGTFPILVKYSPYRFVSPFPPGHEFYYDPVDSNYSLRITWNGHHIHDAPWRSDFGPGTNLPHNNSRGQLATGSIGCVNVPSAAMAQLYSWVDVGTQVTIQ